MHIAFPTNHFDDLLTWIAQTQSLFPLDQQISIVGSYNQLKPDCLTSQIGARTSGNPEQVSLTAAPKLFGGSHLHDEIPQKFPWQSPSQQKSGKISYTVQLLLKNILVKESDPRVEMNVLQ